jgi:hypothetical protein
MRSWRMQAFLRLLNPRPGCRIIDLGGTPFMWELIPHDFDVTLVNLEVSDSARKMTRYKHVEGNACDLSSIPDRSYDIVFSNSVIEHVGDADAQARFAGEARRLAPSYWVQTPSPRFPIEAHTGVPFYWRRSEASRKKLISQWRSKLPVWADMIEGTRVLSRERMSELFPDATLYFERIAGLEKSIAAYRLAP